MAEKYLDLNGLTTLITGLKSKMDAGMATKLGKTETAVAAGKLAAKVNIAGVPFDGSEDITITANSVGAYTKAETDTLLGNKVNKETGKVLSSNDFTNVEKTKLDGIEASANKYVHPSTHSAVMIEEDSTHRFVTDAEKTLWANKYTRSEIDNKISTAISGMDWKASVATYNDIATTYPNPQDGWTVNVRDTNVTYRYTGTAWISISANAIPLATTTKEGMMSKEDKIKLDSIEAGANNYVHPSTHPASMIVESDTRKFVSATDKTNWADKYTKTESDTKLALKLDNSSFLTDTEINNAIATAFA